MLTDAPVMAFVSVTDLPAARAFYGTTLGLRLAGEDAFALEFALPNARMRVTAVGELRPQPFTVVGWVVADLDATMAALSDAGIVFARFDGLEQGARGVWTSPSGARIAWFRDPDGNVLSITER